MQIVSEYVDVAHLLKVVRYLDGPLAEEELAAIVRRILEALQFLHLHSKCVGELQAERIMIDHTGEVKVRVGLDADDPRGPLVGHPFWRSPECITTPKTSSPKCDIWALGITMIELVDGEPPFAHVHPMRAIFLIQQSNQPSLQNPGTLSAECLDFLSWCLRKSETERATADALLSHPFLKNTSRDDNTVILKLLVRSGFLKPF